VWVNLLSNAVKYSANKERPVVEVLGQEEAGFAVYRVRENEVGFDMAHAGKLSGSSSACTA
jgi:light-regulated signal transduction histidine kinase (bacteriophytochrome)